MGPRRWVWTAAFFGVSSLALANEPALRLSGVPNRLVFPLPEGNNLVLTATVTGGRAKSVWLAKTKGAKLKCSMTPAGGGEYQVNLADREASAVLTAGRGSEQFQVFAELEGGKTLASLPVRFSLRREPPKPPMPPKKLDFPGSVVSVTVFQRRSKEEYTGKEATAHLRQKLALAGANVKTLSQFIERVASRSSTTGRRYEIKLSDGSIVPAKQWLEQEASRRDEPRVEPKEKEETGRH